MRHILRSIAPLTVAFVATIAGLTARTSAPQGAVYTASNSTAGNAVLVFDPDADGRLSSAPAVATGGLGTGGGLGNQGGVRLSADGRFLLVVNAGSNDLSVLEVTNTGLTLRDRTSSGGSLPISVTVNGRLVYVLNAGGAAGSTDRVVGFRLSRDGQLRMIAGSARGLSAANTGPAQVEFSPDGAYLAVTEKNTNLIDIFPVNDDGTLGTGAAYASAGTTPFGFAFGKRGQLFVTEAFGGAPDASATSSYQLSRTGVLEILSPAVPTTETAACWAAVSGDGRFVYVTNTGSGSISGYSIEPDGTIALLDADGVTATTGPGSAPIDLAFSGNNRLLFALNSGTQSISAFRVREHGGLIPGATTIGLPAGANGLAAR
ncbi:MAG TPA: beta-propeller fold lactonase family protein [Vicinamibacterales bacterium]